MVSSLFQAPLQCFTGVRHHHRAGRRHPEAYPQRRGDGEPREAGPGLGVGAGVLGRPVLRLPVWQWRHLRPLLPAARVRLPPRLQRAPLQGAGHGITSRLRHGDVMSTASHVMFTASHVMSCSQPVMSYNGMSCSQSAMSCHVRLTVS